MRASQRLSSSICGGVQIEFGIADEVLPELKTGEFAFIVGVPVGPVDRFELVVRQAGDAEHGVVRFGARLSGENHSVIEDDRTQTQNVPPQVGACMVKEAPSLYCREHEIQVRGTAEQDTARTTMRFSKRTDWNTEESALARAHRRAHAGRASYR